MRTYHFDGSIKDCVVDEAIVYQDIHKIMLIDYADNNIFKM